MNRKLVSYTLVFVLMGAFSVSRISPLCSQIAVLGQGSVPSGVERTYGGVNPDGGFSGRALIQTADGGYAIVGATSVTGAEYDVYLIKVDPVGTLEWNKTYGGSQRDLGYSVVQTADGGYAIGGYTYSFGAGSADFYLVRTDKVGNMLWNKTYGGANLDIGSCMVRTSDGGFAMSGQTYSFGAGASEVYLVKTDAAGNMLWNKTYGTAESETAFSLVQSTDEGYAIVGYVNNNLNSGGNNILLVKTDAAGNMLWDGVYGSMGNDIGRSVVQTIDGGYAIAGYTDSAETLRDDVLLVKVDSAGTLEWSQKYGSNYTDIGNSLIQTVDRGFAIIGETFSFETGSDIFLVKTDSAGRMQWNATSEHSGTDIGYAVVQTNDGGYALAGVGPYGTGYGVYLVIIPVELARALNGQRTLFSIVLMVPGPDASRRAWVELVRSNLDAVGINAVVVNSDWDTVYSRALRPEAAVLGKTYFQGGFDALFLGYAMGIDPDPYSLYDSSQFAPAGQNYYLWNNTESDRLCRLIKETTDDAARLQYVKEWQQLAYVEQPSATILYSEEVVAFDPTALKPEPFGAYHCPVWSRVKNWEVVTDSPYNLIWLAQAGPAPYEGLNPVLSLAYYDLTVYDNVFDSLAERNDTVGRKMVPGLASSWSVATDNKTWVVNLRAGVRWHDGVGFSADDVKFTFESYMNDAVASPSGPYVKEILGNADNVEVAGPNTVVFHLSKPCAYFVENILTCSIIPKHVLQSVPPVDWMLHPFNTAAGNYTVSTGTSLYTASGPIGTGPYVYAGFDVATASNVLVKNANYWNGAALEAAGKFKIELLFVSWIKDADVALALLEAGVVDVLDSQYRLETKLASIQQPWGSYVSYEGFGVQELGFNMQHPVFGTGVGTPLGMQNPARSAEAARYVRQAISHLIPRQQIIDTVLAGYGAPGITTPVTRLMAGFDASLQPYSYDVEYAKALLATAGYETGVPPIPEFSPEVMFAFLVVSSALILTFRRPNLKRRWDK